MKRFIITAYILIVSVFLVLGLLVKGHYQKYSNMLHVSTTLKHGVASGEIKVDQIDVIAIGNSQMYTGFIPERFPHSYNLSIPGTMIIDQYYLLEKYLENNPAPKLIIHGLFPQNDYFHYYSFWNFHVRYGAYSYQHAYDLLKNSLAVNEYLFSLEQESPAKETFKFLVNFLSYKFHLPHVNQDILQNIFLNKPMVFNFHESFERNHQQRGYFPFSSRGRLEKYFTRVLKETQERKGDQFEISPIIKIYLDKMIELTKKHQIQYVVLFMPLSEEIKTSTGENTIKGAVEFYQNYLSQYPHTSYLTLSDLPDVHFADNMHYTPMGAAIITDQLKRELSQRGIVEELIDLATSDQ